MRTATTILAVCVAALLVLGSVVLYSAVNPSKPQLFSSQMVNLLIGLGGCVTLALIDYRRWKGWAAWVGYGAALVLLVLVFAPVVGVERNGAHRWVSFGGFQLQSSELAKLALIIALAAFVDRHQRKIGTFKHGILLPGLIIGPVLGLILIEVDIGTTLTLGAVTGIMLLVAGVRWLHALPVACAALLALAAVVVTNENRMQRIEALLHPDRHLGGMADQSVNSVYALSVGGLTGVADLGDNPFRAGARRGVPLHYSDFIFSAVGVEGGLVATLSTVLLFTVFLGCGVYIAWHARDMYGMLVATGITFFICLQASIHMGVVTGVLPNKGFPLPFISHGGTNLIFNLAGVGLLFSIARFGVTRVKSKNPFDRHVDVPVAEAA
jgi:cell division protein FtsW